jgi:vacuolar-type H+-ATPase subunit C/Vma6
MVNLAVHDLDYLVTRLHGRCSRMAAGAHLNVLCRCRTVAELAQNVLSGESVRTAGQFQRRIVEELARELAEIQDHFSRAQARLLDGILARLAQENLKVLLRGSLTGASPGALREHLIALPERLSGDAAALATARSPFDFSQRLPQGTLREELEAAALRYHDRPTPFFFEAALDRAYLRDLLQRADDLPPEDRALVAPLVRQEADVFLLMLVARGRFLSDLQPDLLLPLHIPGTTLSRSRFAAMLTSRDLQAALRQIRPGLLDAMPGAAPDAATVEALAWQRLLRHATHAFRSSHMGFGAVVGYAILRRMEVANLITISEGVRLELAPETIRARLLPHPNCKADDA